MDANDSKTANLSLRACKAMYDEKYEEAAELFAELVGHLETVQGLKHPDVGLALINLAESLDYLKQPELASSHRERAFKILSMANFDEFSSFSANFKDDLSKLNLLHSSSLSELRSLAQACLSRADERDSQRIRQIIEELADKGNPQS